ncbi:MAG: S26 family signal peptidase [Hyphomonadaceae bacterium]|nr:S26 family signal peptidase [Hyphomonadaceae bacterium]
MAISVALLLAPAVTRPAPLLTWNASPSVPTGLYRIAPASPRAGDVALARLPSNVAALAARRGYLPRSAYLLKPVIAIPGDQVCRHGVRLRINGRLAALARPADRLGRPLPVWHGCRTLVAGEVFLLADDPDGFDSRYFGPLDHQHIIGRAFLIW